MYAFLFDRKSLALLATGSMIVGGGLFVAGFFLGVRMSLPPSQVSLTTEFEPLSERWSAFEGEIGDTAAAAEEAGEKAAAGAVEEAGRLGLGSGGGSSTGDPSADDTTAIDSPGAGGSGLPAPGASGASARVEARTGAHFAALERDADPSPSGRVRWSRSAPAASARSSRPAAVAPPAPPGSWQIGGEQSTVFSIQVAAFFQLGRAEVFREELRRQGYAPYLIPISLQSGRSMISVRIGRYQSMAEAQAAAAAYRAAERGDAIVRWRDQETTSSAEVS